MRERGCRERLDTLSGCGRGRRGGDDSLAHGQILTLPSASGAERGGARAEPWPKMHVFLYRAC